MNSRAVIDSFRAATAKAIANSGKLDKVCCICQQFLLPLLLTLFFLALGFEVDFGVCHLPVNVLCLFKLFGLLRKFVNLLRGYSLRTRTVPAGSQH